SLHASIGALKILVSRDGRRHGNPFQNLCILFQTPAICTCRWMANCYGKYLLMVNGDIFIPAIGRGISHRKAYGISHDCLRGLSDCLPSGFTRLGSEAILTHFQFTFCVKSLP
ncbi:unnamed protein product, partial [Allacma fusca]